MEWRTIESAPKDGSEVLVANGTIEYENSMSGPHECRGVYIASWDERDGAWFGGYSDGYDEKIWIRPTHWMPLPEAPR